ncbi:MAG: glutaminase, partial [Mycobacterium sp.]|nr:glutaminase [Mycobacterium sp.]
VYETHGDLLFSAAEQVVRTVDRERENFAAAILDVSRVDDIDDAARELLSGTSAALRAEGKAGFLVDPAGIVTRSEPEYEAVRYATVEEAVAAAENALRGDWA